MENSRSADFHCGWFFHPGGRKYPRIHRLRFPRAPDALDSSLTNFADQCNLYPVDSASLVPASVCIHLFFYYTLLQNFFFECSELEDAFSPPRHTIPAGGRRPLAGCNDRSSFIAGTEGLPARKTVQLFRIGLCNRGFRRSRSPLHGGTTVSRVAICFL